MSAASPLPPADPLVARILPFSFARERGALAALRDGDGLEIWLREGMADPLTIAEARRVAGSSVRVRRVTPQEFSLALEQAYAGGGPGAYQESLDLIESDGLLSRMAEDLPATMDLLETGGDAPVIRLVNDLLAHALKEKASDIHIEPYEAKSVIRTRVDGIMSDILTLKPRVHASVVSRIKIVKSGDLRLTE